MRDFVKGFGEVQLGSVCLRVIVHDDGYIVRSNQKLCFLKPCW